jgi:hypothetical protein
MSTEERRQRLSGTTYDRTDPLVTSAMVEAATASQSPPSRSPWSNVQAEGHITRLKLVKRHL